MTGERSWRTVEIVPTLGVTDLDAAVAYYRELGFEERWRYPADAEPTHAGLGLDRVSVMLARSSDPPERIPRQTVYFVMRNVGDFHRRLRSVLGEGVPPLVESPYGMRDFAVEDPWGHRLTFGEEC